MKIKKLIKFSTICRQFLIQFFLPFLSLSLSYTSKGLAQKMNDSTQLLLTKGYIRCEKEQINNKRNKEIREIQSKKES